MKYDRKIDIPTAWCALEDGHNALITQLASVATERIAACDGDVLQVRHAITEFYDSWDAFASRKDSASLGDSAVRECVLDFCKQLIESSGVALECTIFFRQLCSRFRGNWPEPTFQVFEHMGNLLGESREDISKSFLERFSRLFVPFSHAGSLVRISDFGSFEVKLLRPISSCDRYRIDLVFRTSRQLDDSLYEGAEYKPGLDIYLQACEGNGIQFLRCFCVALIDELRIMGAVNVPDLGFFIPGRRPSYWGRDPRSGEKVLVPELKYVAFIPNTVVLQELAKLIQCTTILKTTSP